MLINRNHNLISSGKGQVILLGPDGEEVGRIPVAAGIHPAAPYFDQVPADFMLVASDQLFPVEPRSKLGVTVNPGRYDSGANPDWQPTPLDAMQRQLQGMIQGLQQRTSAIEARERALRAVQSMPQAPAPAADEQVIEQEKPTNG